MARATAPDTAGSQFFICLETDTCSTLDGSYAAFGKVIDGFDALKAIEKKEIIADRESGKLAHNLVLEKALVDVKDVEYPEPETLPE
jgi:peptidyl-prolyl cis-trans isomerase B (cyclophilin B)